MTDNLVYTLLEGDFVIRYPDLPNQGPEPDGDTVKFKPNNRALVDFLPRLSGIGPAFSARGTISVRLEAIDALETHFEGKHQESQGAYKARDELLGQLGFTNVVYFDDKPDKVRSASHDKLPGYVLSNGIDANGRIIGFIFKGSDPPGREGTTITADTSIVDKSINSALLTDGHVYPAFYGTLSATLREHLATKSQAAREAGKGLWPRSTADPDRAADSVTGVSALGNLVIWPKLFRRVVSYFAAGNRDFDGFDAWLRADSVNRDDAIHLLKTGKLGNLHDVVKAAGKSIQLTVWPEDFIIEPDPA
jgi:endonuclease YncB( thermonuclease family)